MSTYSRIKQDFKVNNLTYKINQQYITINFFINIYKTFDNVDTDNISN